MRTQKITISATRKFKTSLLYNGLLHSDLWTREQAVLNFPTSANTGRRTNRTITFQLNTFVRVRKDTIGSISGIFTHYHDKARRLFIVIEVADGDFRQRGVIESAQDPSTNSDPILCAHTFKMAGERIIVGLPSIGTQRIWVVPAITAGEFWFIDQDVYYM
jgi:hypothetical protein